MEAILPSGKTMVLSHVNNFNFNWHVNYVYTSDAAPLLPKGTILRITAWYDNTSANKNNPDPNQWVGYGDRTVDEMGHAWVNITYMSDADYQAELAKHKDTDAGSSTHGCSKGRDHDEEASPPSGRGGDRRLGAAGGARVTRPTAARTNP